MYGPKEDEYYLFSYYEMLDAMMAVTEVYNNLDEETKDLPPRATALNLLKRAGATPDQAACMLASHHVGISTWKVIKSVIGIDNGVIDAVMEMVAGGYSFYDSVTAIFHNEDYKMILAVAVLSQVVSYAVNTLSLGNTSKFFIAMGKEVSKIGFMIGEGNLTLENLMLLDPTYKTYYYSRKAVDRVIDIAQ